MEYKGFDSELGQAFVITKKQYGASYNVGFDIRYYPAYQGFEGTRSGASVFRPATNESQAYCDATPKQVTYQSSDVVSQIKIVLQCLGNTNATVEARLYFDDPVIEWDI